MDGRQLKIRPQTGQVHPYFGRLGNVTSLPSPLHVLESESKARVLGVKFENDEEALVPRANVEMIESN